MNQSSLERWAPLTGVVGVILLLVGAAVLRMFSYLPPRDEMVEFFGASGSRVILGGYLGMVAAFLLAWFAGSLRGHLARYEAGEGRLAALAFAGGFTAAMGLVLGYSIVVVGAERAAMPEGLSPETAMIFFDLTSSVQGVLFAVALAVQILATAVAALRHRAFPAWFGWVSAALGLLLVSPFGYVGLFVAPLWLAVVSVWVYLRQRSQAIAGAEAG